MLDENKFQTWTEIQGPRALHGAMAEARRETGVDLLGALGPQPFHKLPAAEKRALEVLARELGNSLYFNLFQRLEAGAISVRDAAVPSGADAYTIDAESLAMLTGAMPGGGAGPDGAAVTWQNVDGGEFLRRLNGAMADGDRAVSTAGGGGEVTVVAKLKITADARSMVREIESEVEVKLSKLKKSSVAMAAISQGGRLLHVVEGPKKDEGAGGADDRVTRESAAAIATAVRLPGEVPLPFPDPAPAEATA